MSCILTRCCVLDRSAGTGELRAAGALPGRGFSPQPGAHGGAQDAGGVFARLCGPHDGRPLHPHEAGLRADDGGGHHGLVRGGAARGQ
eukprot:3962327-Pyramimonas_sp.AAC.1